jgi:hypothetical protein
MYRQGSCSPQFIVVKNPAFFITPLPTEWFTSPPRPIAHAGDGHRKQALNRIAWLATYWWRHSYLPSLRRGCRWKSLLLTGAMDDSGHLGKSPGMDYSSILSDLESGFNYRQAAETAGISRQALWKRMNVSPEFAQAVACARDAGAEERKYRAWFFHPFRGRRPPTGKAHGGKPGFSYGRR